MNDVHNILLVGASRLDFVDGALPHFRVPLLHADEIVKDNNCHGHAAKGKELLVLKCAYSPHIKKLQLHREYRKLPRRLRQEVGEGLLDGGKLVVAHPVRTNAFIATYTYNFPQDDINCENNLTQDDIVCENKRDMGMGGRIHRSLFDGQCNFLHSNPH